MCQLHASPRSGLKTPCRRVGRASEREVRLSSRQEKLLRQSGCAGQLLVSPSLQELTSLPAQQLSGRVRARFRGSPAERSARLALAPAGAPGSREAPAARSEASPPSPTLLPEKKKESSSLDTGPSPPPLPGGAEVESAALPVIPWREGGSWRRTPRVPTELAQRTHAARSPSAEPRRAGLARATGPRALAAPNAPPRPGGEGVAA